MASEIESRKSKVENTARFVIMLADLPFTGNLVRIPVALTGRWVKKSGQEIDLTEAMLDDLVTNFAKEANGVNVDYDHASESPLQGLLGPSPSAGKVTKLDSPEYFGETGQKIVWGWYEPTGKARELIASKEYRQISPAISPCPDRKTGEPQGWTLTSVALTNKPVIQEMPEIRLAEGELEFVSSSNTEKSLRLSAEGGKVMALPKAQLKCAADGTHEVHGPDGPAFQIEDKHLRQYSKEHLDMCEGAKASEDAIRIAVLSELGGGDTVNVADLKAIIERGKSIGPLEPLALTIKKFLASEGKTTEDLQEVLSHAMAAGRSANARKELTKIYLSDTVNEEAVDALEDSGVFTRAERRSAERARNHVDAAFGAGKLLPTDREVAFSVAMNDVAQFDRWIETRPARDLFNARGLGGTVEFSNVQEEIAQRSQALMSERKLPNLAKATEVLLSEDRDLYSRYRHAQPQAAAPAK